MHIIIKSLLTILFEFVNVCACELTNNHIISSTILFYLMNTCVCLLCVCVCVFVFVGDILFMYIFLDFFCGVTGACMHALSCWCFLHLEIRSIFDHV